MTKNTDNKSKTPEWAKRERLSKEQVRERLQAAADAAYSMAARTTGDADVRAGLMDRCHMLREALRHLG